MLLHDDGRPQLHNARPLGNAMLKTLPGIMYRRRGPYAEPTCSVAARDVRYATRNTPGARRSTRGREERGAVETYDTTYHQTGYCCFVYDETGESLCAGAYTSQEGENVVQYNQMANNKNNSK